MNFFAKLLHFSLIMLEYSQILSKEENDNGI